VNITLVRHAYLAECTLGRLYVGDRVLATIERPWVPNPAGPGGTPRESCVPDGAYAVRPHTSERYPHVYAIENPALGVYYQPGDVPAGQPWGRTAILIHIGNRVRDVIGCIAIGLTHGVLDGELAVLSSARALDMLRQQLGHSRHTLTIRATAGTSEVAAA